ncbi:MAG: enoyl-CoA hydratase/isomerase family protein, partial [Acidimicrobiales bacterium]
MSEILYEVSDPVATITLNRPERLNAFTTPMLAELRRLFDRAAADPAVVGIVVAGNGRGFCAGLDAQALAEVAGSGRIDDPPADARKGLFSYLTRIPKPVIAAVDGVAAGGGYVLATMADMRFGGPGARFTT